MTGRYKLFLVLLVFLAAEFAAGEDLIMEVKPNPVRKGYQFNVTLYVDYDKPSSVEVSAPQLPSGFRLVRGPAVRGYYVTAPSGTRHRKTRIRYTYLALKTGRFILGSYRITAGDKVYVTEPRIMGVALYKNRKLYIPYEISWKAPSGPLYVGQAVPLVAEAENLPDILIFDNVTAHPPSSGIFTEIDNPGQISELKIGNETLYKVPVAGFIYTPSREGTVKIPGIRVSAGGVTSLSDSLKLRIHPVPEGAASTGAVGRFSRTYSLDSDSVLVNENIDLTVTVAGIGNLNYLEIPLPDSDGMDLAGEKDKQDYTGTISGYKGKREKIFSFVSDTPGNKSIVIPPFPFLDPETGKVEVVPGEKISVNVLSSGEAEDKDPVMKFSPEEVTSGHIPLKSERYRSLKSYLWLVPGPALFLVFFIKRRKKFLFFSLLLFFAGNFLSGAGEGLDGNGYFEKGLYSEAVDAYLMQLEEYPYSSSLYYDLALSYYRLGSISKAVYSAQYAAMYNPLKKKYSELLRLMEMESGIDYSVSVSRSLYPDLFLFFLTILVNVTAYAGIVYLVKKKNFFFILAVLLLGLSLISAGGLVYSASRWNLHYGVASSGGTDVKKIPDVKSDNEFTLLPGETVRIIGRSGDYDFIENGIGLKGWVELSDILVFGGNIDPLRVLSEDE